MSKQEQTQGWEIHKKLYVRMEKPMVSCNNGH